jgi:ATP-dependent protease HslVU (ClpYQ) peptidase subunit
MTTIIAQQNEKGDIRFAWDSQVSYGHRHMVGHEKVFKNGPVTFGVSGTVRTSDILKHMTIPARGKGKDTRKWIVNTLVPAIIKELKAVDAGLFEDGQINSESSVIIAVDGQVGVLGGDFAFVQDATGVYGVGSGSHFALGAMGVGASPKQAVQVAGYFDLYTNQDVKTLKIKAKRKGGDK